MKSFNNKEEYIEIIEEIIEGLGLKLIKYILVKQKGSIKALIDIHKPQSHISHDDCSLVVKNCKPFLDEKFDSDVLLEVSSPGVNRILKTKREYKAFEGYEVEVYLKKNYLENDDNKISNGSVFILGNLEGQNIHLKHVNINNDNTDEILDISNITKMKLLN